MNRDETKSKVDESSSKSNSVLGRREEGLSSSHGHTHVNNLEEQQRLMMLRSQGMPRAQAFNQHANHMNNLEEEQRLMRLQQEQDAPPVPLLPPPEGLDPLFEAMMAKLKEDLQYHWHDPDFYFTVDELLDGIMGDDVNEGHLQGGSAD